jgi:hypothetical protein
VGLLGDRTRAPEERLATESAGLVAIDAAGSIVSLWDTPFMAWAKRTTAAR